MKSWAVYLILLAVLENCDTAIAQQKTSECRLDRSDGISLRHSVQQLIEERQDETFYSFQTDESNWFRKSEDPAGNQTKLSKTLLLSTNWVTGFGPDQNLLFCFFADDSVRAGWRYHGQQFSGSYEIDGDTLRIIKSWSNKRFFQKYIHDNEISFIFDPFFQDIFHRTFLRSSSDAFDLFPAGSRAETGMCFVKDNLEVTVLDGGLYTLTRESLFYTKPSIHSSRITGMYFDWSMNGKYAKEDIDRILPGDYVSLHAKSVNGESQDGQTGHWYLCRAAVGEHLVQGWIFNPQYKPYTNAIYSECIELLRESMREYVE